MKPHKNLAVTLLCPWLLCLLNPGITTVQAQQTGNPQLWINLHHLNNGVAELADGVVLVYEPNGNPGIDSRDAVKLPNPGTNLAIRRGTQHLMVERRPPVTLADTLPLFLWGTLGRASYQLQVIARNFTASSTLRAFIHDAYRNETRPLALTDTQYIRFETEHHPESTGQRFTLFFVNNNTITSVQPIGTTPTALRCFPNPARRDGTLQLQGQQLPAGRYEAAWITATAATQLRYSWQHPGGVLQQLLNVPTSLPPGTAYLRISREGKPLQVLPVQVY